MTPEQALAKCRRGDVRGAVATVLPVISVEQRSGIFRQRRKLISVALFRARTPSILGMRRANGQSPGYFFDVFDAVDNVSPGTSSPEGRASGQCMGCASCRQQFCRFAANHGLLVQSLMSLEMASALTEHYSFEAKRDRVAATQPRDTSGMAEKDACTVNETTCCHDKECVSVSRLALLADGISQLRTTSRCTRVSFGSWQSAGSNSLGCALCPPPFRRLMNFAQLRSASVARHTWHVADQCDLSGQRIPTESLLICRVPDRVRDGCWRDWSKPLPVYRDQLTSSARETSNFETLQ